LYFHIFGKNGVLKELEPVKESKAHELGVVVEVIADNDALAQKITDFVLRMFFFARIPGVKGTAGTAATTRLPMRATPGYKWSVNHTMRINDPLELFPTHIIDAGV
jgi:hypothetical protein